MHTVAIVQARMTSERLPGKVLLDLAGRPLLEQELLRLQRSERLDEIALAVTTNPDDDPLIALADRLGLRWYRGSEQDVLARYLGAAAEAGADLVVRVTSDCPLIDPVETDRVVASLQQRATSCDYAANLLERTLPRGLDTEALWSDVLERIGRMATSTPAREHVTWFCRDEHPELFRRHSVRSTLDAADLRWTVDTAEDLALVRRLYEDLGLADDDRSSAQIIAHIRSHPELGALNGAVVQKPVRA